MTKTEAEQSNIAVSYLMPADYTRIRCVDGRVAKDVVNSGVAVPGGIDGIIDAVKALRNIDEASAWKLALDAGIPVGGHTDELNGAEGCGYAKLVEQEPETVLAPESVTVQNRISSIEKNLGEILTLLGEHQPSEAVINLRQGTTIDTKKATEDGLGIFCYDAWAMPAYADALNLDPEEFTAHLLEVYKKTVTRLTGLTKFSSIE